MIFCEKAARICDKAQYNEATFFEVLLLKFHLIMCKACTKHSKKNGQLTTLCTNAKLHALSELDKKKLKEKLKENL